MFDFFSRWMDTANGDTEQQASPLLSKNGTSFASRVPGPQQLHDHTPRSTDSVADVTTNVPVNAAPPIIVDTTLAITPELSSSTDAATDAKLNVTSSMATNPDVSAADRSDASPFQFLYDALNNQLIHAAATKETSDAPLTLAHTLETDSLVDPKEIKTTSDQQTYSLEPSFHSTDTFSNGVDHVEKSHDESPGSSSLLFSLPSFSTVRRHLGGSQNYPTPTFYESDDTLSNKYKSSNSLMSNPNSTSETQSTSQSTPLTFLSSWIRTFRSDSVDPNNTMDFSQISPASTSGGLDADTHASPYHPDYERAPRRRKSSKVEDTTTGGRRTSQITLNTMVENILASQGYIRRESQGSEALTLRKRKQKARTCLKALKASMERQFQSLQDGLLAGHADQLRHRLTTALANYTARHGTSLQDYDIETAWYEDRKRRFMLATPIVDTTPSYSNALSSDNDEDVSPVDWTPAEEARSMDALFPSFSPQTTIDDSEQDQRASFIISTTINYFSLSEELLGTLPHDGEFPELIPSDSLLTLSVKKQLLETLDHS